MLVSTLPREALQRRFSFQNSGAAFVAGGY
jgi:hypothetical protein